NGVWTQWYETGLTQESGYYKKDKKDGYWIFYDSYGVVFKEQQFENGLPNGKWISYYANGQKSGEGCNINGYKEGKWIYYDEKGTVVYMVTYKKGVKKSEYPNPKEEEKKK
ncbi:MAG: hypothetical protein WC974_09590, partial [Thermoplasmata archaeon]